MVSTSFNQNCRNVRTDVFADTACKPWIQVTVRENDVGLLSVFLCVILLTSKRFECPVIVRSQIVLGLASCCISCLIENIILNDKNGGVGKAVSLWHGKLVASQAIPTACCKRTSSRSVFDIIAEVGAVSPVEVHLSSFIKHYHDLRIGRTFIPACKGLARDVDWIAWHWLKER